MATVRTSRGLRVSMPETYELSETTAFQRRRGRRTRGRAFRTGPLPQSDADVAAETDELLKAFEEQEIELVDDVEITATEPSVRRDIGGGVRALSPQVKIDVDLGPNEGAVILLEQDGVYSWELPGKIRESTAPTRRRGRRAPAKRTATFRLTVAPEPAKVRLGKRRGMVQNFIVGKIRAFVLRFVAGRVVDGVMKYLERTVEEGPVIVNGHDPSGWTRVKSYDVLTLPHNRPAKILLLVHGTFSSTVGSYGALGVYAWGREFLDAASHEYDAIIGYDHRTLGKTPYENALDLLEALKSVDWAYPPHFDVIAFSRGGLVFRSLVEQIHPVDGWNAHFDRTVFVACTNGGTELADPNNWHTLLDLYTNIAVAGTRALGLIPAAAFVSRVLRETVRGLGSLLKFMASEAVTEGRIPGLAAMDPGGAFIKEINQAQAGQPTPQTTQYFAVTSEFDTRNGGPKEFSKRLLGMLADRVTDRLMGAANDLVVDKPSMTAIDLATGNFIKDRYDFGPNPTVYHTVYFNQPQVADLLTRWFQLDMVAANGGGGGGHGLEPGGAVEPDLPAVVEPDIVVHAAETPIAEVAKKLEEAPADFVVIRREYGKERLHYGFKSETIRRFAKESQRGSTLRYALDLHETDRAVDRDVADVRSRPFHTGMRGGPEVVLREGKPVGVVSDEQNPVDSLELAARSRARRSDPSSRKKTTGRTPPTRRGSSTAGARSVRRSAEREAPPLPVCHFHAEMAEQAEVGKVTSVDVLVSREEIERATGRVSVGGRTTKVDWQKKLIIQIMPRANCEVVGDRRIEIDPPAPGAPRVLMFDLRPTNTGDGEVWVLARQGQVPLVTLILKPKFVKRVRGSVALSSVSAARSEAAPLKAPLHQLRIFDRWDGKEWFHEYELFSPKLKILDSYESKRFKTKREKYVNSLYRRIEGSWVKSKADYDKFMMELRSFGATLYEELFPEQLRRVLWENRNNLKSIQVISQEPFIPWELVHLKEDGKPLPLEGNVFLGEMGLVRWLHNAGWAPTELRLRKDKALYVIPDYPDPDLKLAGAQQEAAILKKLLKANAFKPEESVNVYQLLNKPGSFDVLHFACHGEAAMNEIWDAGLMMKGRMSNGKYEEDILEVTAVENYGSLTGSDGNRPLVFVNACQAGRGGYKLTGLGGFAQAFIRKGAGAFIGALWSIGDTPALHFAEEFYSKLKEGKNVSEATIAARRKSKDEQDATWLSYTVYAHPHGVMK